MKRSSGRASAGARVSFGVAAEGCRGAPQGVGTKLCF